MFFVFFLNFHENKHWHFAYELPLKMFHLNVTASFLENKKKIDVFFKNHLLIFEGFGYTFKGNNSDMKKITFSLGTTLKGKNWLPLGANSFL